MNWQLSLDPLRTYKRVIRRTYVQLFITSWSEATHQGTRGLPAMYLESQHSKLWSDRNIHGTVDRLACFAA